MRPSSTVLKRAAKARRAAARSTFQKLLADRASFRREEALRDKVLQKLHSREIQSHRQSPDSESECSDESSFHSEDWPSDFWSGDESCKSRRSREESSKRSSRVPSEKESHGHQNFHLPKGITGPFWEMDLVPLSKREENSLISNGRIFGRSKIAYGEYKVAPNRYDLQVFHRKYWMSRAIRQALLVICPISDKSLFKTDLLEFRNIILKYLGNGSKRQTKIQRKLLSSVYFCLRQVRPTISRG